MHVRRRRAGDRPAMPWRGEAHPPPLLRLRQRSRPASSLKKGGAGESGFCYEAGASVEVAPEEALGSGGWGEKKKTPKAQHAGWCSATVFAAADVGRSA